MIKNYKDEDVFITDNLNVRICDIIEGSNNNNTLNEEILLAEQNLNMCHMDIEGINNEDLLNYLSISLCLIL